MFLGSAFADAETDAEVLFDGQLRKDVAPLRNIPDAQASALLRSDRAEIDTVEQDLPGGGQQSHDALQECRLTHPVAPHQARAGSLRDGQVHVPQDVTPSIKLVQAGDRELAHAPR